MMNEFEEIRNKGGLLYEYIRGSHLYGLNTEESDVDTSGIFMTSPKNLLWSTRDYKTQVSDAKHDNTWFEVGEFTRLLLKSNPTIIEALFVPHDKVIGEINPIFMPFLENRDLFISKECFNPFYGYAKSQIEKARGLNKKITLEENGQNIHRRTPYEFIYTFHKQGSTKLKDWLANRGLKPQYCGLNNTPNMHDVYGLYYDWGMHIQNENVIQNDLWVGEPLFTNTIVKYFSQKYNMNITVRDIMNRYGDVIKPLGYRGIINEDGTSTEVRLSEIETNDMCLTHISFNKDGYILHCKQYKEFVEWQKNRNEKRYESNLSKSYDSKNMMHCFRMIHMAKEIAEGQGVILQRTEDKEFLMNVRAHKYEYDEIMSILFEEKAIMEDAMAKSKIKEKIDTEAAYSLLADVRKKQLVQNFLTSFN